MPAASKVRSRSQPGPDISLRLRGEPTVEVWIQRSTTTVLFSISYHISLTWTKHMAMFRNVSARKSAGHEQVLKRLSPGLDAL